MSLLSLSNAFLPSLYDLHLVINHTKPNFTGVLVIDLVRSSESPSSGFSLTLHASKLILTKCFVELDGVSSPLTVKYDRPNQTVTLSADIDVQQSAKVSINYVGQINMTQTYQDKTQGLFKTNYLDSISGRSNNYILATHFQPFGARSCYPLIDELNCKVPVKLTIDTLAKFKVCSVGKLLDVSAVEASDNTRYTFEQTPPIASSVFGFTIGDFEYVEQIVVLKTASIPCRVYTTLGDSGEAKYALTLIAKFLPIVEKLLAVPYPLSKLDFVALPFLSDGAMENWGLVTVLANQFLVGEPEEFADRLRLQQLVAHELIHQWIGNLVTFDEWSNLWLNEALATWIGNHVVYTSGINSEEPNYNYELDEIASYESFFDKDCFVGEAETLTIPSIHEHMNKLVINHDSGTSTIFNIDSYEKGIILVRMLAQTLTCDKFFEGLSKMLKAHQYKALKPFDIWNSLNEFTSIDVLSFMHSWLRYPGYPILRVSQRGKELNFEQHIYLYNLKPEQVRLEDKPFHLPLQIQCTNGKLLPIMLTDRNLALEIGLDQLVNVNHNRAGYYRTIYERTIIEQSIIPQILNNSISRIDLISIINDYGKILGTVNSSSEELTSLMHVIDSLAEERWELDYAVLKVALNYLETINNIFLHYSDYVKFDEWLVKFSHRLFNKIGDWDSITQLQNDVYNADEMNVRNSLLQFGLDNAECQGVAKKVYRSFVSSNSHKHFTPRELMSSAFNLTIRKANQKEYKRILELVKNANESLLKYTNISAHELQTIALSSLSFVLDDNLLSKSLNFVLSNIDSKLIELGLIGFQFTRDKTRKLKLFQWYKIHYDAWVLKATRNQSAASQQSAQTLQNISRIVLGDLMQQDSELIATKDSFISEKKTRSAAHGLVELVESLEDESESKRKIASFYGDF